MEYTKSILIERLRELGPPLHEQDVLVFEEEIGASLPVDYRDFLLKYNGGGCYDEEFIFFPTQDCPVGDPIGFIGLLSLDNTNDPDAEDIRVKIKRHHGRLPSGMVPIGGACSDLILLDPHRGGCIYLWTRDLELSCDHPDQNQFFLANSFTEFLLGCYYESEEEREGSGIQSEEPFHSIEIRRNEDLKRFLDDGFPLFERNARDQTLLYVACMVLNYEAAEELLHRGADPDDGDRSRGYPPIFAAAAPGASELVKLLLSYGASPFMDAEKTRPVIENLPFPPTRHMIETFRPYQ